MSKLIFVKIISKSQKISHQARKLDLCFYDSLKKILEPIRKVRDELEDSCSSTKNEFIMLQHQKIVQSILRSH